MSPRPEHHSGSPAWIELVIMALTVCSSQGCPELTEQGRCEQHRKQADKDRRPEGNPYNGKGHRNFRRGVLARNPICVICLKARAIVADHYPQSRRELVRLGLNPDDPQYGRGLCASCHNRSTAELYGSFLQ